MSSDAGDWTCLQPGYPIRTPSDHSPVIDSPRLIADSNVLHRFLVPRHPPCALKNLATKMLASTMQFSTHQPTPTSTRNISQHQPRQGHTPKQPTTPPEPTGPPPHTGGQPSSPGPVQPIPQTPNSAPHATTPPTPTAFPTHPTTRGPGRTHHRHRRGHDRSMFHPRAHTPTTTPRGGCKGASH